MRSARDQTGGVRPPVHRPGVIARASALLAAAVLAGCSAFAAGDDDRPIAAVVVPSQTGGETGDLDPSAVRPGDRPSTVAMVGDSITVASAEHLTEALAGLGLEVLLVDAQVGRRMTVGQRDHLVPGSDVVQYVAAVLEPELWILALGTNDIGQYPEPGLIAEQVAEVLRPIPEGAPVVWVDTWIRDRPDQARAVNEAIRSALDARPAAIVVDWASHATDDGVLAADGVHLSDGLGRVRFAEVVASGIEALIGPAPTS